MKWLGLALVFAAAFVVGTMLLRAHSEDGWQPRPGSTADSLTAWLMEPDPDVGCGCG